MSTMWQWKHSTRHMSRMVGTCALAGALLFSACGGEDDDDDAGAAADPTNTLEAVTGTPEGGGPTPPTDTFGTVTVTPVPINGSPEASPTTSPEQASPDASPVAMEPVDLATAWDNLLAQPSYAMTIDFEGLPAIVETLPMVEAEFIMELESVDDNRHVVLSTVQSGTVAEMWLVDDEIFVDFGDGPTPLDEIDTFGLSEDIVQELLNAPEALVSVLASADADWEVTNQSEEVNDFTTMVQEASYSTSDVPETMFFDTESSEIDSTMWVETEEQFLVQLDATLTTPETSTTGGTPVAEPPARIFIDVLSVGDVDEIEVPTNN